MVSQLLRSASLEESARRLRFCDGQLDFSGVAVNAYFASVAVDMLRRHRLERRVSFTFECVMSHPGKLELLAEAQQLPGRLGQTGKQPLHQGLAASLWGVGADTRRSAQ
jgi:hypothetical protein